MPSVGDGADIPVRSAPVWPAGIAPTPEFETALDFINKRHGDLFVTGRAGTGKSTLLRTLRDSLGQSCAVVAPTGLAGVQVGGQTIHSFFGLPPRLIQPEDIRKSRNGAVMRRLDTLIIDEVSMVRADLMHAIDMSLRLNRGNRQRLGQQMRTAVQRLGDQRRQLPRHPHAPFALNDIARDQHWPQMPPACALNISCKHPLFASEGAHDRARFAVTSDRTNYCGGGNLHDASCQ